MCMLKSYHNLRDILLTDINHVSYNIDFNVFPHTIKVVLLAKLSTLIISLDESTCHAPGGFPWHG